MQQRPLRIIIQVLGSRLRNGEGRFCLDFDNGKILPWEGVAERDDAGEGRPALERGKRFIRIPAFEELFVELKKQMDDIEKVPDKKQAKKLPKDQRSGFLEFSDFLRGECADSNVALRWIASLRPSFPVEMVDETAEYEPDDPMDDYTLFRYDPNTCKWSEN